MKVDTLTERNIPWRGLRALRDLAPVYAPPPPLPIGLSLRSAGQSSFSQEAFSFLKSFLSLLSNIISQ